ncbi:RNA-binding S4 domain-containing protein [Chitinasiproducens palmae]|uniref:Ribosome-associated protein n=1 Tax=Chitinasiproducens palmae TaxID=1770053 RepID=A0A1H2PJB5_9BURK|nr:RNA-binding S4 domain-containing protein [Chitinasiproducens palmae]SDV46396.1 ribosome-associated protein [Chitinasiproducens palmae]
MNRIEFMLRGDFIPLNDLLKVTGLVASGGAGKVAVAQGEVTVDGEVELRKTRKIVAGQTVGYGDTRIRVSAP